MKETRTTGQPKKAVLAYSRQSKRGYRSMRNSPRGCNLNAEHSNSTGRRLCYPVGGMGEIKGKRKVPYVEPAVVTIKREQRGKKRRR